MEQVSVRAATGIATLVGGGSGTTDENGRFDFRFSRGIFYSGENAEQHSQTQVAVFFAFREGFVEQNLCRHDGMASLLPLEENELKRFGKSNDQMTLPDRPRALRFVMVPAARVSGQLVDEAGQPLKDYSVSLTGENLPPASSVLAQVYCDEQGRFEMGEIPSNVAFHFRVRKPRKELGSPWLDSWASPPMTFLDPKAHALAIQVKSQERDDSNVQFVAKEFTLT